MSTRILDWLSDPANYFTALLSSMVIIMIDMWLAWWLVTANHEVVLNNHLWSYNFQLSQADEGQWDCALSDELENTWICVPRDGE